MTKNRRMISTGETARLLNEDPRTVQRKAKAGEYQAEKMPGLRGAYIFDRAYVQRLVARRQKAVA